MGAYIRTLTVFQCQHPSGVSLLSHLIFVTGRKDVHLGPEKKAIFVE